MENEFKIRCEYLNGTQQIEFTSGSRNNAYGGSGQQELVGGNRVAENILRGSVGAVGITGRADDQAWNRNAPAESESAVRSGGERMQENSEIHSRADNELLDELNQPIGEAVVTGWEVERGILLQAERIRRTQYETQSQADWNSYSDTIGTADIVDSVTSVVSIIDNAPTDPEELERYIEAQRTAQNAGLLIGAAVAAIELLSEKLEEMKADAEDIDMDIS